MLLAHTGQVVHLAALDFPLTMSRASPIPAPPLPFLAAHQAHFLPRFSLIELLLKPQVLLKTFPFVQLAVRIFPLLN